MDSILRVAGGGIVPETKRRRDSIAQSKLPVVASRSSQIVLALDHARRGNSDRRY